MRIIGVCKYSFARYFVNRSIKIRNGIKKYIIMVKILIIQGKKGNDSYTIP
jgi:hypothetical protein